MLKKSKLQKQKPRNIYRNFNPLTANLIHSTQSSVNLKPLVNQLLRSKIRFGSVNKLLSKKRNTFQINHEDYLLNTQFNIIQPQQRQICHNIHQIYSENNLQFKRNIGLSSIDDQQIMTDNQVRNYMFYNIVMM